MNVKILALSVLVAVIFLSSALSIPPVQTIPTNRMQCNTCHSTGGTGTLTATYLDGTKPENNIFTINPGETIGISLNGIGAQDQNEPGVVLIFDPAVHHHFTVKGATPGGEGSYAFYVRDGDENDKDPKVSDVKGDFQLTADTSISPGEYSIIADYLQAGPTGVNVELKLKVLGPERESSSISLLVTPLNVYANKDVVYISGGIRPANVDHVNIELRVAEEWQSIAVVKPSPDGSFSYEWRPTKIEEYSIRAVFEGDKNFEPAVSEVFTVNVEKSPQTLMNQIATAILLGLMIILIGTGLFYRAGRGRYLRKVGLRA